MTPADAKKDQGPRRPWRENIEAVTMAIVVAVMLKYFVVEAYKIPSGSMQPTLMGDPKTETFDRILVDKLSYHFRDPERFEVAVFKYPLNRSQNFIKRICGMPGEQFAVRDGDLWTRPDAKGEWKILRRPRPVQQEVWKRIDPANPRFGAWKLVDGAAGWNVDGRARVAARGKGGARLPNDGGPVRDDYRDGYPGNLGSLIGDAHQGIYPVGDLRLECDVSALAGCTSVIVELREGSQLHRFEIPGPTAPADARPRIATSLHGSSDAGGLEASAKDPWKLGAGAKRSIAVQNMDDLLQLEIGGEIVATLEVPGTSDQASSFTLRVDGEGADFSGIELYRDIYYTQGSQGREFTIPPGHYVMLGDNTQNSSDSREWQLMSFRWPGEGSDGRFVRGNDFKDQNPLYVHGDPQGTRVFFRDEWGELHDFVQKPDSRGPNEAAPYVPRELIVGRAVLVFWPQTALVPANWFDPSAPSVWRLKWVH